MEEAKLNSEEGINAESDFKVISARGPAKSLQRKRYKMLVLDIDLDIQKKGWCRFPGCKGTPSKIYYLVCSYCTKCDIHLSYTKQKLL